MPRNSAIKVRKSEAEALRKKLMESDILNRDLKVSRDGEFVVFPVKGDVEGYEVIEWNFEENGKRPRYQDIAEIPDELGEFLPTSFDVIGDVVIIKIPDELKEYESEIGNALLKALPSARVVTADRGVRGEYRVRDLEIIAGKGPTETVHTEYGIRLKLDPARAYFSPRLANEHHRIAELVQDGEEVVDMFTGVGPFAIMIAKMKRAHVYAIDLNPAAIDYLERNIRLNNITGVEPINADARFIIRSVKADRVIMNLPQSAIHFFEDALSAVDDGWVHYYEMIEDENVEERTTDLVAMGVDAGKSVEAVNVMKIRNYAPGIGNYVWDLRVSENE